MNKPIRHGEVFLLPVDKMAPGRPKKVISFIAGHSESGHHHILESEAPFNVQEKAMFLELFKPAKLVHKKTVNQHRTITVPAGKYKILKKTEYDPFAQMRREVWD